MSEPVRTVLIRDFVLAAEIGVFAHEKGIRQRVRFNVELAVEDRPPRRDARDEIICYDRIVTGLRDLVAAGHVNLVETLAERAAALCVADPAAVSVRLRVEKLDVYPDVEAVGIEIVRTRAKS